MTEEAKRQTGVLQEIRTMLGERKEPRPIEKEIETTIRKINAAMDHVRSEYNKHN